MEAVSGADGEELQEGGEGGNHQGGLDQDDPVWSADAGCSGNNNRRGDTANDHGYYVLQSQGKCLTELGDAVQLKNRCRGTIFIHNDALSFY